MRSVVRRVQFVNRLMRLESDYSEGEGRDGTRPRNTGGGDWSAAGSLASQ